jgi:3-deoxy-D-manno-octulosonic-acid transferase
MSMQSDANAEAARAFAPEECRVISPGSLKADLVPKTMDDERRRAMEAWLLPDDLPLVAAGSTTGLLDDALVVEAFHKVREQVPCRLLIAPRDPKREPELLARLGEYGLSVSRRSKNETPAEVLLLDTFGELATAYGFARAAYVGGFLGKGGGHNVLEPAVHGVPVAYGPNRGHFEAEQRLLEGKGAGTKVANAAELAEFWIRFLLDSAERNRIGELGKAVLAESRGAVDRTAEEILELLERRAHKPGVL